LHRLMNALVKMISCHEFGSKMVDAI